MTQVEFVLGRSGSGKTTYCYHQIEEGLKENSYDQLMLLVPEQFNLQTQRDLAQRLYPGLLRAEVISFNTLARAVFQEVGKVNVSVIEDLERMIILKKVIEEHKKEIIFYKKNVNNTGFIESINRLITVFEQSGINKEILEEFITDEKATSLFKSKMTDLQNIYSYFEAYIKEQFITVEKNMSLLAQAIHKSQSLKDTHLWIDGFYGFTATQITILKELIKIVKSVTITFPMDKNYGLGEKVRLSHPFYESIQMYQKLMGICEEVKVPYKTLYLSADQSKKAEVSPEIAYLEAHYLAPYQVTYKEPAQDIHLKSYSCRSEEVEKTAQTIVSLIRDEGYRYHDIAIIVGDLSAYKSILEGIFKEYEIPYFLDMKRNIHTNGLVASIEGVLEILTSNYSYKSMMSFLRTYRLPIPKEDIDSLENYILAYGIKGKKKWQQAWAFDTVNLEQQEHINETREKILTPILKLEEYIKNTKVEGKNKVVDLTKGLYYFLEDIEAYEALQATIDKNKADANRLLELENTQIWGQVVEVFERLVDILGEERLSVTTYKKILQTSFSYLKMGIIPPSQDQVLVGAIDRTRLPRIKATFILGTNEGLIPKVDETTPIFSDMDKVTLAALCEKDRGPKERLGDLIINQPIYAYQFMLYTTLTRATRRLYVSAALADENGKLMRPSLVFYKLKKMFKEEEKSSENKLLDQVHRPLPTFGYIGGLLREYIEGRVQEEEWKDIVSWYAENEKWQERLKGLTDYLFYSNQQHYLQPATTKLLYEEKLKTNISQLESFRNCACCYFMRYGIKAEERKIFSWDSAKVGTLFHAALEQYPKELELLNTTWTTADQGEMDEAVKKATLFAVDKLHSSQKDAGKFKYTASKVEKMTKRAIRALTTHLKNGEFVPTGYEINFGEGRGFPPIEVAIDEERSLLITGQIDRVDIYYKEPETSYIKILDYKSGNKNFSLLEVYYGLQLQLLLYLDAYLKLNKDYEPGGIFYFHINNPYVSYKVGMDEEAIEESGLKQFKLSGLVLEKEEVIKALDKNNTGTTIPVSVNKDGSIKKGSSVASQDQFELLEKHIIQTVRDLGKQILEGKVSAKPFKLGDKSPCVYCSYKTICQFNEKEPDNCYDTLDHLSKEEVWEKIRQREEEN